MNTVHSFVPALSSRHRWFVLVISFVTVSIPTLACAQSVKESRTSETLSACSFNIRMNSANDGEDVWPNRMDTVVAYIRQHDVVGLQEVTPKQFDDLRQHLKDYDSYGLGRDDGKAKGESAAVFFRKDRLRAMEANTLWLSEDPKSVGSKSWDAAITRTMTWMEFQDLRTDAKFLFVNTHFDHIGKLARLNSARQIASFTKRNPGKLPIIVLGDFNCTPDSAPYAVLADSLQDARLHHDKKTSDLNSTWNGFQEIQPGRVIDHVFVSDQVDVTSFAIENPKTPGGRFASDHLPVVAMVQIPKTEAQPGKLKSLVWSDEFNGDQLDRTKWKTEVNALGGGNREKQFYTDRKKNVRLADGKLIIEAHREPTQIQGTTREYSSARLSTKHRGDWKYGRVEIRAKLPAGQGIWPAIWMMPTDNAYGSWAASGEIDIMEMRGRKPDTVLGTLHHTGEWPNNKFTGGEYTLPSSTFADQFHTFAIQWRPGEITWLIDGVPYQTQTEWSSAGHAFPAPFDQRFHLLLNVAVGGNFVQPPTDETTFPARMEIDWVRIYQ